MRKLLEDFYYGNLAPDEQKMVPDSELRQAVGRIADCEDQLIRQLDKSEQNILSLHGIFAPCPSLFLHSHQQMIFCSTLNFSHNKAKKRTTWFPK